MFRVARFPYFMSQSQNEKKTQNTRLAFIMFLLCLLETIKPWQLRDVIEVIYTSMCKYFFRQPNLRSSFSSFRGFRALGPRDTRKRPALESRRFANELYRYSTSTFLFRIIIIREPVKIKPQFLKLRNDNQYTEYHGWISLKTSLDRVSLCQGDMLNRLAKERLN